jgi:surface polysaccharide O-acyltransferase-like enzyme
MKSAVDTQRRHDIDWLRTLAVMMLVFMHTATIFTVNGGSVVKGPANTGIVAVSTFFGEFLMPLMFFIAGASVWLALGRRSPGRYLGERVKRLLVPLAFGIVAVLPILSYLYAVNREDYQGSFFGTYLPMLAHFPFGHLWFILYLFLFSLVTLPFFLYLRSPRGSRFTARLGSLCERRGGLILFFLPLTLLELVRRALPNPNDNDVARFLLIAFFVYGFLAFSDPRIGRAIERNGKVALALMVPVMATIVSIVVGYGLAEGAELSHWMYGVLGPLSMINATLVIVTMLSYGKRYLNADSRALRYLSQASYPFYILHLVPIALIAYFVMQWNLGAVASYLIIVPASFAGTFLIYEVVVRRTSVTRFLFGVKQPRKARQPSVERGTSAVGAR